jgi:N4-gp56 family major capsid protein
MANETTTSTVASLLPEIVAEAMFVAQERSIMRGLVKNFAVPFNGGLTVNVPIYNAVSAAGLTEGTDLGNTAVTTGVATLSVAEVGLMTTVTDLARRGAASNIIGDVGRLFGEAIAKKMDQDLMAEFANLTGAVIGSGAALTAADIFEAAAKLRNASVPAPLVAVINPLDAYDLKGSVTSTFGNGAAGLGNEAMVSGYIGSLAGIEIYESANATTGAVFHRDALGLAMMADIALETQRDASLRADEIVGTATYGVGVLHSGYGSTFNIVSSI